MCSSDLRIRIAATNRSTYPDLSVVYGEAAIADDDPHAITNPTVVVEVLSESTERSDRGEEFAHYRHLGSLREYVLVGQDERRIEVFRRDGDAWVMREALPGQSLALESLGVLLSVGSIYRSALEG